MTLRLYRLRIYNYVMFLSCYDTYLRNNEGILRDHSIHYSCRIFNYRLICTLVVFLISLPHNPVTPSTFFSSVIIL